MLVINEREYKSLYDWCQLVYHHKKKREVVCAGISRNLQIQMVRFNLLLRVSWLSIEDERADLRAEERKR